MATEAVGRRMMDARGLLRERAGTEMVERLDHLDRVRGTPLVDQPLAAPDRGTSFDADVVFLGGGLSLLIAAEVARLGRRVVVLDRVRAGQTHREWNASDAELEPLVTAGFFSATELEALVVARYDKGICRFHDAGTSTVRGVLDRAVDAGPLLERVRDVATQRGVRFVDGATVTGLGAGEHGVRVRYSGGEVVAKVAVDARGASSPYASADLVCPTVGGVMRGLDFDPRVGDILVTTEDAEDGRQHVWEGFPGRTGELTVYLFYYTRREEAGSLLDLYARYFETLGGYRSGQAELVRPTFGYIPGWSRLTPAPRGPHPRVVLVGDAAARHSPLTFCGFGSMLRSFQPLAARIASERHDGLSKEDEPIHAYTGFLAHIMAAEKLRGHELNALLGAAFSSLEELGNPTFAALLQDRLARRDFIRFLHRTSLRHPAVYRNVLHAVGPEAIARWALRVGRDAFSVAA